MNIIISLGPGSTTGVTNCYQPNYNDNNNNDNNNNNSSSSNNNNNNNNNNNTTTTTTTITIIAFKGAIRDVLQSPHCAAKRLQHLRQSGPGLIVCKSRATHRALSTCNVLRATLYEGRAQLLSLTELKSHLF